MLRWGVVAHGSAFGRGVTALETMGGSIAGGKAIRPAFLLADTADLIHSSAARRAWELGASRWISSDPVDVEN